MDLQLPLDLSRSGDTWGQPCQRPAGASVHANEKAWAWSICNVHRPKQDRKAFLPAFEVFADTTAAASFDVDKWPSVTNHMDNYQRCVQWVLTNQLSKGQTARMVVLSPFETNALISETAATTTTMLSLYAPSQNMAFAPC
mgnify:CR=1 FL=1